LPDLQADQGFLEECDDVFVFETCALIFAATYIVVNSLADAIAIATNPKLMYAK
jgi:peptide/nickel transport system permease protein